MDRGYICLVQNTDDINYLEQAYALALNLKLTQNSVSNLSICVDLRTRAQLQQRHVDAFDKIIDIPWGDAASDRKHWKIDNKWKFYHMSPYDETVILDTDMIFPIDVSDWWNHLSQQDVWSTTRVMTYRGELVTSDYYRKTFTANKLPNVYTAFFYFKKSDLASELFTMIEYIFQHWQRFFYKYLPAGKPDRLSGDVAYALAMKLLGVEHLCTNKSITNYPVFVHMKSHVQNVRQMSDDWTNSIPTYYNSCTDFKVGNFQQVLPFHYVDKQWMTPDKILQMEKQL